MLKTSMEIEAIMIDCEKSIKKNIPWIPSEAHSQWTLHVKGSEHLIIDSVALWFIYRQIHLNRWLSGDLCARAMKPKKRHLSSRDLSSFLTLLCRIKGCYYYKHKHTSEFKKGFWKKEEYIERKLQSNIPWQDRNSREWWRRWKSRISSMNPLEMPWTCV